MDRLTWILLAIVAAFAGCSAGDGPPIRRTTVDLDGATVCADSGTFPCEAGAQ